MRGTGATNAILTFWREKPRSRRRGQLKGAFDRLVDGVHVNVGTGAPTQMKIDKSGFLMEISTTAESWREDARALMVHKRKFVVSGWSVSAGHKIANLVKEFDYAYDLSDDKSRAFFQPRN